MPVITASDCTGPTIRWSVPLAKRLGITRSIIITRVHDLLRKKKSKYKICIDNEDWVCLSYAELAQETVSTKGSISYFVTDLVKQGFLKRKIINHSSGRISCYQLGSINLRGGEE